MNAAVPTIPPIQVASGPSLISLVMALRGLAENKFRAFLTMLGVIIGVGAVIIAVSIGQGSREAAARSLRGLGTNVLTVFAGESRRGGVGLGMGSSTSMNLSDVEAVLNNCITS